ncbi:hypothetical protein [Chitinimonas sp. BJYL2]|uniref:hypothetical protein n=1 Tax=Chitinimonas sp. BJYL2 TaxID=2976696 RepID=UPI0022B2D435|nr:hypothetical protein [Chitinimonas sp. BJYL2]
MKLHHLLICCFLLPANAAWVPSAGVEPQRVFEEARTDRLAGRYEDALVKHQWFFAHAHRLQPALGGVRVSFAMQDWVALSKVYPPASAALDAAAAEAAERARAGKDLPQSFHDAVALFEARKLHQQTRDLYVALYASHRDMALRAAAKVRHALVQSGDDALAAETARGMADYLDIESSHQRMLQAMSSAGLDDVHPWRIYISNAAALIAVLARHGRQAEADQIATRALGYTGDSARRATLEQARLGVLPTHR